MMNMVLQKLLFIKIYSDDVFVHITGTPDEHLQALEQVFQYLREADLKLKLKKKCVFFKANIPNQTY